MVQTHISPHSQLSIRLVIGSLAGHMTDDPLESRLQVRRLGRPQPNNLTLHGGPEALSELLEEEVLGRDVRPGDDEGRGDLGGLFGLGLLREGRNGAQRAAVRLPEDVL